jgi:hypothetical protein
VHQSDDADVVFVEGVHELAQEPKTLLDRKSINGPGVPHPEYTHFSFHSLAYETCRNSSSALI